MLKKWYCRIWIRDDQLLQVRAPQFVIIIFFVVIYWWLHVFFIERFPMFLYYISHVIRGQVWVGARVPRTNEKVQAGKKRCTSCRVGLFGWSCFFIVKKNIYVYFCNLLCRFYCVVINSVFVKATTLTLRFDISKAPGVAEWFFKYIFYEMLKSDFSRYALLNMTKPQLINWIHKKSVFRIEKNWIFIDVL